jgi:hypothetical protein
MGKPNWEGFDDGAAAIRSALASMPFTAPEAMGDRAQDLLDGVSIVLESLGYTVKAVEAVEVTDG